MSAVCFEKQLLNIKLLVLACFSLIPELYSCNPGIGLIGRQFSLECRSDLVKVYKNHKDMDKVNPHNFLPRVKDSKTRAHSLKVRGERDLGGTFRRE